MKSIIRVIDLETAFEATEELNGICEYGHCDLVTTSHDMLGTPYDFDLNWDGDYGFQSLVYPGAPFAPDNSGIHNIVEDDVRYSPRWEAIKPFVTRVDDDEVIRAFAAHNIKMESTLIGKDITGDIPWICTYKVALHLWNDLPSHSNNAIRYALKPEGLLRHIALPTHRAFPDAYVTAFTLREALNLGHSIETLVAWTNAPVLTPRCKIGEKYKNNGKGTPWKEVESGMLRWILDKDFDEDTKYTARYHLEQREIDQRLEAEKAELDRQFVANGMSPSSAPATSSTQQLDL